MVRVPLCVPGPEVHHAPAFHLLLHKPSGQARITTGGKQIYLGRYGSPESKRRYAEFLAQRFADPVGFPADQAQVYGEDKSFAPLSINELLLRYLAFASTYYVKDGHISREIDNIKASMRPLRALYGHTAAAHFGPRDLKAVQRYMIGEEDLYRTLVNARIKRLRRVFKWAVSEELIPPSVHQGLCSVDGLRYGRTDARESDEVETCSRLNRGIQRKCCHWWPVALPACFCSRGSADS